MPLSEKLTEELYEYLKKDDVNGVRSMLEKNADMDIEKLHSKVSALQITASRGSIKCAQLLIDYGANIDAPHHDRPCGVLSISISFRHIDVALLLLNNGALVQSREPYEQSPIHEAADVDSECIQILLDHGADIDHQNRYGRTALMIAAEDDDADCIKTLINNGASVHILNGDKQTALDIAVEHDKLDNLLALLNPSNKDKHTIPELNRALKIATDKRLRNSVREQMVQVLEDTIARVYWKKKSVYRSTNIPITV